MDRSGDRSRVIYLLGGFSVITNRPEQEETQTLQGLNALFYGSNAIEETTLVAGDQDNRIVRLSLKEPSPAAPVVAYSQQNLMIISDF